MFLFLISAFDPVSGLSDNADRWMAFNLQFCRYEPEPVCGEQIAVWWSGNSVGTRSTPDNDVPTIKWQ